MADQAANEAAQLAKFALMTEHPVEKLVLRMAAPTIASMLVTSLYNMADTFFVARISTSATGAVGVVFPLMAVVQAFGFFFGQGSGNYMSRKLGARDVDEAARMAATGFFVAFAAGAVLAAAGLLALKPLATLLGSSPTMLPHTEAYLGWILLGAPFMTSSLVLNNQLRLQGNAFYGMVGIIGGAALNILLDPLFIFVFELGVAGAAIATVLSQMAGFTLLLFACRRRGAIAIRPRNFAPSLERFREIAKGGLPSLARQGLASAATVALNLSAVVYGDAAVAGMSVVTRIMMFAGSALIGFGQGFQPVCGFNFGAGRYDRVLRAFFFCVKAAAGWLTILSCLGWVFAPEIVAFFRREDPELIAVASRALRCQCLTFPLVGWVVLCNMLTQNINDFGKATVLSAARQGLFFLPAVLVLPRLRGLDGVLWAQPVSDVLSFLLALLLGGAVLRRLSRRARDGAARPSTPAAPAE